MQEVNGMKPLILLTITPQGPRRRPAGRADEAKSGNCGKLVAG